MQGYPPGYDPSMDPTLSGGGGYQVGMDPAAGSQMAPAPGMGQLGMAPHGATASAQNVHLSGGDQFAMGAAQTGEMATNAFFLGAMSAPLLRASGHRGLGAAGAVMGKADPFRMVGMGHRGVVAPMFRSLSGTTAKQGMSAGMRGLVRGGAMRAGGRLAIMGGTAASGWGAPIAIGMALMEAPIQAMEAMASGIQDQYTGMATMAAAAPAGMRHSSGDAKSFGFHSMPKMADSMGMDMGGMQEMIGALGEQGTFNGAKDMKEFSQKLRTAMQQLKDVARETGTALADANQMIGALNSQGFGGSGLQSAATSVNSRGAVSGLGTEAIYASGAMGGDVGRQFGLNRQTMFNQFSRGASTMAHGTNAGRIDSNLVDYFGGAQQASAMVESQAVQGFMGSSLMAYAMDPTAAAKGQSVVNQDRLQQVMSGGVNAEMLRGVSPEMINASLQERARHVLMPNAQQAITAFGTSGGASDATASARMAQMGFTASPEQALLMLQQGRAASFEATAVETHRSRNAGIAQQEAMEASTPGFIKRSWRESGYATAGHSLKEFFRGAGREMGADWSDIGWGTPDEVAYSTDRSTTAGGLESARRLTSDQTSLVRRARRGDVLGFGAGAGTRYDAGSWAEGGSGSMSMGDLRSRNGWGFDDMFEAGEDQLTARHNQIRSNPVLSRSLVPSGVSNLPDSAMEGRDFVRTESSFLGIDNVIGTDTIAKYNRGLMEGASSIRAGERGSDARQMLKDSLYVNNAEGGSQSARQSLMMSGRNSGLLSQRGHAKVSDQERAALVLREQVLRRSGAVEGSVSESEYAGMDDQTGFMARTQGALSEASGYDEGLQTLIGATGNVSGGMDVSGVEIGADMVRSLGSTISNSLDSGFGSIKDADLRGFRGSFSSSPEFRDAFADILEISSTVGSRAEAADGYTAEQDAQYRASAFATGKAEINRIATEHRDSGGGEALRHLARSYNGSTNANENKLLSLAGGSNRGVDNAGLVRAAGAVSQYHRASDPAMGRLTERITDFNMRHQDEEVVGRDRSFEGDSQSFRDAVRRETDATYSSEEEGWERAAANEFFSRASSESGTDDNGNEITRSAMSMQKLVGDRFGDEFGGVSFGRHGQPGSHYEAFTNAEERQAYLRAKQSQGLQLGGSRWNASDYDEQKVGSVGQEFYRGVGGLGSLSAGSSSEERLLASQELISSLYDYQGDQTRESTLYKRAVGEGRANQTTRMVDTLLGAGDSSSARADAVSMLRSQGHTDAVTAVEGIIDSESSMDREGSMAKVFEALGQRIDQTLVSESEQAADTATIMARAASSLQRAGDNLQIAAGALGGPPGESDTT